MSKVSRSKSTPVREKGVEDGGVKQEIDRIYELIQNCNRNEQVTHLIETYDNDTTILCEARTHVDKYTANDAQRKEYGRKIDEIYWFIYREKIRIKSKLTI